MSSKERPIVIGHRGASGHRPEHTLESYRLAIEMGADSIEPDLVPTKDGHLIARHENEISSTTDVASKPQFASRKAKKSVDGTDVEGCFTEDFTLAEIKTLRAKERLPQLRQGNTQYDGQFEVPTLEEVISLAQSESKARGRTIGIYPELKHPSYFEALGHKMGPRLVEILHAKGYRGPKAPVFIQCFEVSPLREIDYFFERRHLEAAVVLRVLRPQLRQALLCAQRLDLGQREVLAEPAALCFAVDPHGFPA